MNSRNAGPATFKAFFSEINGFQTDASNLSYKKSAKPETYWKQQLISDRGYPAMKSVTFQMLFPGHVFPDPL